ncbi:hypothetical protein DL770_002515 [Monosporascus sp. CRB-9-2]|nr:hypothetical protein DL770_002515 [Monosporascus sp. CRB-9-2]
MAPGPNATATAPQRPNPVYQEIIEKGSPIFPSSPAPIIAAEASFRKVEGKGCQLRLARQARNRRDANGEHRTYCKELSDIRATALDWMDLMNRSILDEQFFEQPGILIFYLAVIFVVAPDGLRTIKLFPGPVFRSARLVIDNLGKPYSGVRKKKVTSCQLYTMHLAREDAGIVGDVEDKQGQQPVHAQDGLSVDVGRPKAETGDHNRIIN